MMSKNRKRNGLRVELSILVPVAILIGIFIIFVIATKGNMASKNNLKAILDQSILIIIGGCGMLFVVAQGGCDMSVGTTLALSSVLGSYCASLLGTELVIFPVTIRVACGLGALNAFIICKFRVPSFMTTLAMLIGIRGLVNFLQHGAVGIYYSGDLISNLRSYPVKIAVLIILLFLTYYLLEHTKVGKYSKAIGENEMVAITVGIPVTRMKFFAFMIAAVMAGIAGMFSMAKMGGTTTTMGSFYELELFMSIYLGGVLVTGGYSANIVRLLVGAFTLSIIKNGLVLVRMSTVDFVQLVQSIALLALIFITIRLGDKVIHIGARKIEEEPAD